MSCQIKYRSTESESVSVFSAEKGERLYDVLARNGVTLSAPCGGQGRCGKCRVRAKGSIRTDEDGTCLSCQTIVEGDCEVFHEEKAGKILTSGTGKCFDTDHKQGVGFAVDIGTTTLAAYLCDLDTGDTLASASMLNPQRIHGADVISRLNYACSDEKNAQELHEEIVQGLKQLLHTLLKNAKRIEEPEQIPCAFVGNTTMMHFLGAYDARGIAKAPYLPYYTALHMRLLDLNEAIMGGCISGYVGADTLAAMLACDMDKVRDTVLLIDIGTNGELVLSHKGKMMCCSCAAGPAFEGAHIACGTGAVEGAIDHLFSKEGGFGYTTIGGIKPAGICGSGLMDIVSYLIENEYVNAMGRMQEPFRIESNIRVEPQDIREVQLAKAAIAAGIEILARCMEIDIDEIDRVLLAGGFGNYMDVRSACRIGLIPETLLQKIQCVGNAAGDGARMLLLKKGNRDRAEAMRKCTQYIDLAAEEDFQDIYTDNLIFDI